MIGARPSTRISRDSTLAAIWCPKRSRTEALATTCPALPPSACRNLASTSSQTLGAIAHSAAPTRNSATPKISGPRRPIRSDSGPNTS